ncbi:MAG: thioredoxin-disulfide reductase [Candidatus Poribacteria bacterium]|nr:thioredoxin-disulfide reductase [Candidatus Poribacteria bacterium]
MPQIKMYTTDVCPYCDRAKRILEGKGLEFEEINIHGSPEMRDEIERLTGRRDVPQLFIDDQHIGDDDDLAELAHSGQLDEMLQQGGGTQMETAKKNDGDGFEERNVIIIGGGTAGFATGVYTSRAMLEPLLITGDALGGQLSMTLDLENYPGFFGTEAAEFIKGMQKQAERFGTEVRFDMVTEIDFNRHPFYLKTYDKEYLAKSVIICTGASPRTLNVPGEEEYGGRGVSYCATCDGFFFQDQRLIVVGGGDAALEEGIFLTKYASEVYIVHRRDQLRASPIMQERAFKNDKIKFIWSTTVEEIQGDGEKVMGSLLKNVKTGEEEVFPIDGVFIFVGHLPNTELFKGVIDLDEQEYIVVDKLQRTNIEGVFAAGDVHDHIFRQAITAAGAGAAAAISADKFIAELEDRAYPGK